MSNLVETHTKIAINFFHSIFSKEKEIIIKFVLVLHTFIFYNSFSFFLL